MSFFFYKGANSEGEVILTNSSKTTEYLFGKIEYLSLVHVIPQN